MVTPRNACFSGQVGAAGRQQRSFAGMSVSSMLCIGHVSGEEQPWDE